MRITVFAAGSRGDVQPCAVLSRGLREAGYRVRLAAPEDLGQLVREHAVDFYPLRGDVQRIMASASGRRFMEQGGANPISSIRAMRTLLAPVVMQMAEDAFAASQGADAIVCLGVLSAFGRSIAQALSIPIVNIEPTPLLPTRDFPAPGWPVQRSLGGLHNYLSGLAMLHVLWLWYKPFVNDFGRRLGLPPCTAAAFSRDLRSTPMLGAYSPTVIPPPADWPKSLHVTGYLFPEAQTAWQPPRELLAFLEAGAPPVYIGFGSMSGRSPEQVTAVILEALAESGQRGLLLTGWGGLRAGAVPESVFVLDSAPHDWLFPRMAAVVHHGGAGTTAAGLRAGVPTVTVPFLFDQPFWGARVRALGLGPDPVPQKDLTAHQLARAITTAVSDPEIRQRARAIGRAISAEDGVANAVGVIRRTFGEPSAGRDEWER